MMGGTRAQIAPLDFVACRAVATTYVYACTVCRTAMGTRPSPLRPLLRTRASHCFHPQSPYFISSPLSVCNHCAVRRARVIVQYVFCFCDASHNSLVITPLLPMASALARK